MALVIDNREPTKKIQTILDTWTGPELPDIKFKKLDLADYLIDSGSTQMLIERKQMNDFCANHVVLRKRMEKMREQFEHTALLTEGDYRVQGNDIFLWRGRQLAWSLSYDTFSSYIASQQARGSMYFHTQNLRESILRIVNLHNYLPRMGKSAIKKTTEIESWLAELPGMGPASVSKLAEQYTNPLDALKDIDKWYPKKNTDMLMKWFGSRN
jgi:ERCC4-type nuclease